MLLLVRGTFLCTHRVLRGRTLLVIIIANGRIGGILVAEARAFIVRADELEGLVLTRLLGAYALPIFRSLARAGSIDAGAPYFAMLPSLTFLRTTYYDTAW